MVHESMSLISPSDAYRLMNEQQAARQVASILKKSLPLTKILHDILETISAIIPQAEFGVVMLWDQSSGLFRPLASIGCEIELIKRVGLHSGESITGKVYEHGVPILLASPEEVQQAMTNMRPGNRSILARGFGHEFLPTCTLAAPISMAEQKFGVLVFESFQSDRRFDDRDLTFLQLAADWMAIAIDHSRLIARADTIRQTREAERLRSEMMATLSHELRMPLTTIKGYSTMLLMDEVDWDRAQITEYLQLIDDECETMHAMVAGILDSSLMDVNQLTIEPQAVRIQNIAHAVVNEVQHQTSSHHLIVDMPSSIPLVRADARWVKQVFRNILDNAVKYSPNGGMIVIRGEARVDDVVISIADQGIGISPEDLIPIFEKYFRVRTSHTMNIPGSGLGLPIARAIVEVHGGRIWAESKLGQGTTLYFSLPLEKPGVDVNGSPVKQDTGLKEEG